MRQLLTEVAEPPALAQWSGSSPAPLRLHHSGYAVPDIDAVSESFCKSVGGIGITRIWEDPIQRVRVAFILPAVEGEPCIELVAPSAPNSPVLRVVERGGGLYHLCYETPDLDAELLAAPSRSLTVVRKPHPAVAFGNRRIAWLISREKLLIEYVEAPTPQKMK